MWELYWITRLTPIHIMAIVIFCVGIFCTVMLFVHHHDAAGNVDSWTPGGDRHKQALKELKFTNKGLKASIITMIIGFLGIIFVPNTRQGLLIWGVGSTIDYLKENPTAKQLPDKCINALDKWVDSFTEEKDSIE